ncbi:MAG: DNA-directed RNA polymerase subunit K [Hadesarchaea archaeon]|nr:DNA-directed RNA polymerase subunit K [Hadesarchaea archaeon]
MYPKKYTRFEKARVVGARALQIEAGAPVLIDTPEDVTDPVDIALLEFEKDIIPMTIVRRLPSGERISSKDS